MSGHGIGIPAKGPQRPIARALGVGHRLQCGESFRGDDEKRFLGIEAPCRFREIRAIDVGDEPKSHPPVAVILERLVGHDRPEVGTADADVDHVADAFAGVPLPCAAPDPVGEISHLLQHGVNLGDHVFAVHDEGRRGRRAQSHMQDCTVFRDVDPVTPEHGIDALAKSAFFRQVQEESERFIRDAIFRVIEKDARGLHGQTLSTLGIIREELAQVHVPDLFVVDCEGLPRRTCRRR
jgi:hypothetical protein